MEPTTFTAAVATLNSGLRRYIATRPVALQDMYLARFLPPVRGTSADIKGGGRFRFTTQPAALTAVDSPYFKTGGLKVDIKEAVGFKITAEAKLSESNQDQMHEAAQSEILRAYAAGSAANVRGVYENTIARMFEDQVMLSLDYGEEQYRAITLAYGKMDVIDGNTGLAATADFKVPESHKVERKTSTGDAYHLKGSKFWEDVQTARERLNVEPVFITDPTTWNAILNNPVNGIAAIEPRQVAPNVWVYTVRQMATKLDAEGNVKEQDPNTFSQDYRRRATAVIYGTKPDLDAGDEAYLWPKGRITFLRQSNRRTEIIDGQVVEGGLGVTYILPNTEMAMASQRFGRIYVPEQSPWEVIAQGAEDLLPYLDESRNVFLVGTELS